MQIRPERPEDIAGIRMLHRHAFATTTEAVLVDALREQAQPIISLVADVEGVIAGHILFSSVTLSPHPEMRIMGLAPMAVSPARQRQGVGSTLVRMGLDECQWQGVAAVVVLGHASYYPRFGFRPASAFGLACQYNVPDDGFMALELTPGVLRGKRGTIRYHPAFASV
jgi:putative acetyltransferase